MRLLDFLIRCGIILVVCALVFFMFISVAYEMGKGLNIF